MFKILSTIIFLLIAVPDLLPAQEIVQGTITYVSRDNAYIDLGKKAGVQVGDTLRVAREGDLLGLAVISQSSGASSAVRSIDPAQLDWLIGDRVEVIIKAGATPSVLPDSVVEAERVATESTPAKVFLDSSAFMARTRSNMSLDKDRFSPQFSGYLSTRVSDRGGDTSGVRISTGSLYGQFKIQDLGLPHLDASTYVRSNQSSSDSSMQTSIYSAMLTYANPLSKFSYVLGRMYHPQFSMLGTLDGLGITFNSPRRILALAAGNAPAFSSTSAPSQRQKLGVIDEERFDWGYVQIGTIAETEGGELSRNFILLGTSARLRSNLRLRGYSEFDLDLFDQSEIQGFMGLSRFRSSMNWRPWRGVVTNFRYSYREDMIDLLDTAETEYDKAARHMFAINMNLMLKSGTSISSQAKFRGDGSDRQIQIYGISLSHRDFSPYTLSLNGGAMAMFSYLSEGGRLYVSLGKQILPWLDVDVYDELFLYRILGESSFRTRHLPEISLSAKVPGLQRLRLRTRFEQEEGQLLYRVSLSMSKHF